MEAAGIHSLLLFGWWDAGMDAGYPTYAFDEAQGGRPVLAQGPADGRLAQPRPLRRPHG